MSLPRRGLPGPKGNQGNQGEPGEPGEPGKPGLRGAPLSWAQALAMFLLIVLIGTVTTAFLSHQDRELEQQQRELERQQRVIKRNAAEIYQARVDSCHNGVDILQRFNKQYDELIAIERSLARDPLVTVATKKAAIARVKAYQNFKTEVSHDDCPN